MRQRLIIALIVGGLAWPVLAACSGSHQPAPSSQRSVPPTVHLSNVVPVVECPTTRGVPGRPQAYYPDTIALSIPAQTVAQLSYYSDDVRSLTPILAPRGWHCSVSIGADGSTSVKVFPAHSTPHDRPAVTAQSNGGCVGCMVDMSCGLIPRVRQVLNYTLEPCPTRRVPGEQVNWINGSASDNGPLLSDVVGFEDPPGVKGTGDPSGGQYPANGVLLVDAGAGEDPTAAIVTCTVPQEMRRLCTAALNDAINQDWPSRL